MNLTDVKSNEDILNFIEGCLNDFEGGVSSKNETIQNVVELIVSLNKKSEEPYFGWCEVDGCNNEGCNGGGCWRNSGYWTVCSKHSAEFREGKPQPEMKQSAIDREKTRLPDGTLPYPPEI